jgi:hypothetical protein
MCHVTDDRLSAGINMDVLNCHPLPAATPKSGKRFDLRCEGPVQAHESQPCGILLIERISLIKRAGLFHRERMRHGHLEHQHRFNFVLGLGTIEHGKNGINGACVEISIGVPEHVRKSVYFGLEKVWRTRS